MPERFADKRNLAFGHWRYGETGRWLGHCGGTAPTRWRLLWQQAMEVQRLLPMATVVTKGDGKGASGVLWRDLVDCWALVWVSVDIVEWCCCVVESVLCCFGLLGVAGGEMVNFRLGCGT